MWSEDVRQEHTILTTGGRGCSLVEGREEESGRGELDVMWLITYVVTTNSSSCYVGSVCIVIQHTLPWQLFGLFSANTMIISPLLDNELGFL